MKIISSYYDIHRAHFIFFAKILFTVTKRRICFVIFFIIIKLVANNRSHHGKHRNSLVCLGMPIHLSCTRIGAYSTYFFLIIYYFNTAQFISEACVLNIPLCVQLLKEFISKVIIKRK